MKNNQQGFAPLILIGIIAATFVLGTGTVVVSNSSKPGDTLYSVDRAAESLQLALAFTDSSKKDVHAMLATERLTEIKDLQDQKEPNSAGIADARSNFEEHRAQLTQLANKDGSLDQHENELEKRLEQKQSTVDKAAEAGQKNLETERESLKKQYEQALKDGDAAKAATLKAQIAGFEQQLKAVETERESQKQTNEKQAETEKKVEEQKTEAEKKAKESESENQSGSH